MLYAQNQSEVTEVIYSQIQFSMSTSVLPGILLQPGEKSTV